MGVSFVTSNDVLLKRREIGRTLLGCLALATLSLWITDNLSLPSTTATIMPLKPSSNYDAEITQMIAMGFDPVSAARALVLTKGDVTAAVEVLLTGTTVTTNKPASPKHTAVRRTNETLPARYRREGKVSNTKGETTKLPLSSQTIRKKEDGKGPKSHKNATAPNNLPLMYDEDEEESSYFSTEPPITSVPFVNSTPSAPSRKRVVVGPRQDEDEAQKPMVSHKRGSYYQDEKLRTKLASPKRVEPQSATRFYPDVSLPSLQLGFDPIDLPRVGVGRPMTPLWGIKECHEEDEDSSETEQRSPPKITVATDVESPRPEQEQVIPPVSRVVPLAHKQRSVACFWVLCCVAVTVALTGAAVGVCYSGYCGDLFGDGDGNEKAQVQQPDGPIGEC